MDKRINIGILGMMLLAGCATKSRLLIDNEASALEAATDRARLTWRCPAPKTQVITSEVTTPPVGQAAWTGSGRQAKYSILVSGCGENKTLVIWCQEGNVGCAVMEPEKSSAPQP